MSAMHHDTSSDLSLVGSKLKDILEVCIYFDKQILKLKPFEEMQILNDHKPCFSYFFA